MCNTCIYKYKHIYTHMYMYTCVLYIVVDSGYKRKTYESVRIHLGAS